MGYTPCKKKKKKKKVSILWDASDFSKTESVRFHVKNGTQLSFHAIRMEVQTRTDSKVFSVAPVCGEYKHSSDIGLCLTFFVSSKGIERLLS